MSNRSNKSTRPLREGHHINRRGTGEDPESSSGSDDSSYNNTRKRPSKYPSGIRLAKGAVTKNRGQDDTSPEDGDDEDGEDEDVGSDEEEEDVLALPAGKATKRRHQTGLSIELSNTSLGKRGRSPGSDDIENRPMSKMSKTDGEGETSDDDAYNAVNDISESEEEDEFERNEERQIVDDEEAHGVKHGKRGSVSSVGSFFGMLDEEGDESIFPDVPTFFDDQMEQTEIPRRGSILTENTDAPPTVRRVRFAEEVQNLGSSSSATESEDEAQIYPDLFLQQDALDPSFRRLIERNDPDVSDEGSYWDFENDGRVIEELDDDESGSETGSSGYETDEGETTDEDSFFLHSVKNPQVLHARSNTRSAVPATPATTPVRRALNNARRGPIMGTFVPDKTKPIAVVSGQGTHLLFYPPTETRPSGSPSHAGLSSPGASLVAKQPQSENESEIGFTHADPMLSSPANAMHSGIFGNRSGSAVSSMSTQVVGPTEAFYPFVSLDRNGDVETDDVDFFDDLLSADEDLNIEDFINFGDQSSDEENNDPNQEQEDPSSNSTTFEEEGDQGGKAEVTARFTPVKSRQQPATTPSKSDSLLSHFDKGVASSFRRNADRHKTWTRSPIGAGIKGGRFDTANIPISPLRRRRGMSGNGSMPPPRAQPSQATTPIRNPPHTFGGPLKKRIQNSNQQRKGRKSSF